MTARTTWAVIAAAATLMACATSEAPQPQPQPDPSQPAPAPEPPPEPPKPADTCGAEAVRHLVGRPRTEIPIPLRPDLQRVACTTCPVTMDFNANRLNFFFDAQTGLIKEVRCG